MADGQRCPACGYLLTGRRWRVPVFGNPRVAFQELGRAVTPSTVPVMQVVETCDPECARIIEQRYANWNALEWWVRCG